MKADGYTDSHQRLTTRERVDALLGPDPKDAKRYWLVLASPETDWSAWAPPAAERAEIPDSRQAA